MSNPAPLTLRLFLISANAALEGVLCEYAAAKGQIEITDAMSADFLCASHMPDLDKNQDRTKPILFLVPHGGITPSDEQ